MVVGGFFVFLGVLGIPRPHQPPPRQLAQCDGNSLFGVPSEGFGNVKWWKAGGE